MTFNDLKTTYYIWIAFAVLGLVMFGISCTPISQMQSDTIYKYNIVRVFMHEPHHYSVHRLKEDKCLLTDSFYRGNIIIICDVPEGESMWYEINGGAWYYDGREHNIAPSIGGYPNRYNWVRIHIHSALDINGGGWDHGKHGRGQTQVIE